MRYLPSRSGRPVIERRRQGERAPQHIGLWREPNKHQRRASGKGMLMQQEAYSLLMREAWSLECHLAMVRHFAGPCPVRKGWYHGSRGSHEGEQDFGDLRRDRGERDLWTRVLWVQANRDRRSWHS
jgi:hypothetical protein